MPIRDFAHAVYPDLDLVPRNEQATLILVPIVDDFEDVKGICMKVGQTSRYFLLQHLPDLPSVHAGGLNRHAGPLLHVRQQYTARMRELNDEGEGPLLPGLERF